MTLLNELDGIDLYDRLDSVASPFETDKSVDTPLFNRAVRTVFSVRTGEIGTTLYIRRPKHML